ncbi:MAG: VOC family protein [Tolypothrix brevis GSE-NOS-MK-07-07A]|jgi:PhnB protein|nr:VOC family protein [Tolypothrix brevis GSE-NOS-MK-07-07A]
MSVKPIPEGYHTVTPYLIVKGVESLIEFLTSGFAATEICRIMHPDGSIMHAEVKIGDSFIMMGEAREDFQAMPSMIHLYVENADAIYERAIQAGATSVMEPKDEFYGDRAAGVKDQTGNCWWIATHQEDVSPEELEKRRFEVLSTTK